MCVRSCGHSAASSSARRNPFPMTSPAELSTRIELSSSCLMRHTERLVGLDCVIALSFCPFRVAHNPLVAGGYAYCTAIQELDKHNRRYRVLALSATPGTDLSKVQDVITQLHIAHIEVRYGVSLCGHRMTGGLCLPRCEATTIQTCRSTRLTRR